MAGAALAGALVGRYSLRRVLARGGMAEVWEGWDEILGRPVAVKILLGHLAEDADLRERFRREAVTAARLVHPGIVAIFDAGVEARPSGLLEPVARAFIVMELVRGETLRDLIARSAPIPPSTALAITAQVADALSYAHAQGLVHRDIKPANVLLSEEEPDAVRVKVTDFGIAKVTAASAAAVTSRDLTAAGVVLGTPKYLAPEQIEGREPDARADLYSLGVVLFEMLVGQPPFSGATDMATALAHVQEPAPRLERWVEDVPSGLADLVDDLLAKDPAHRVASALVLCARLGELYRGFAPGPQGSLSRYWIPAGVLRGQRGAGDRAVADLVGEAGAVLDSEVTAVDVPQSRAPSTFAPTREGETVSDGTAPDWPKPAGQGARPGAPAGRRPEGQGANLGVLAQPGTDGRGRPERGARVGVRKPGRVTSALVGVLVLAGCLATVELVLVHTPVIHKAGQRGASSAGGSSQGGVIRIVRVREITQDGNKPNDNVSELPYLFDGSPKTSWMSDVYFGPRFGGSGGFGLAIELGAPHIVHRLSVATSMQDWSADTFVANSYAGRLSGWGGPTDSRSGIGGDTTFTLGAKSCDWVLLWLIDPGPTHQAEVQELTVS